MRTYLSTAAIAVSLLAGCQPLTEDNAPEKLALSVCRKERACDTDGWHRLWAADFEQCVDKTTDAFELVVGVTGFFGADIDLDDVRDCRSSIRTASCDAYAEGDLDCGSMLSW